MNDTIFDRKSAEDWIAMIEQSGAEVRENDIYPGLRAWLSRVSPSKVLDIGAGQGVCAAKVVPSPVSYVGLEPSPYLLHRAQELYEREGRRFVTGSVYEIPFPAATFDAVFSVSVWHLLSDLSKAARELSRVLKPGGHFFIITANPDAYEAWDDFNGSDGFQTYPLAHILSSLTRAGLTITKTDTYRPSEKANGNGVHLGIIGVKMSPECQTF